MYNVTVHKIVAETFIPNELQLEFINHIDGNKHNNIVDNLEWCTNEYNHEHAVRLGLKAKGSEIKSCKLNESSVYAIKWLLIKGISHSDISKAFKISRPTISLIASGKTWKHVLIEN